MPRKSTVLVGHQFFRLTVVGRRGDWAICDCACGKKDFLVRANCLSNRDTKSCGCWRAEVSRRRMLTQGRTHGMVHTITYRSWISCRQRCHNVNHPDYHEYGARGIEVCERWRNDFSLFLEDMGERPSKEMTLERKDNEGNYEPSNCLWADKKRQARNRRNAKIVEFEGRRIQLNDLCDELGINTEYVRYRLYKGHELGTTIKKAKERA